MFIFTRLIYQLVILFSTLFRMKKCQLRPKPNKILLIRWGLKNRCYDILSTCHLVNLPFYQLAMFCLPFCQHAISAICTFINLPFCELAIWSTCHFINLPFCKLPFGQLAIWSICHFVNRQFHQFALSSICHFVNLQF